MILIDALYINKGGGKVLLDYLITCISRTDLEILYLLDNRLAEEYDNLTSVIYLRPNLIKRHIFYLKRKGDFNKILCFGNIPPTVHLNVPVYTYFHNSRYIKLPSANDSILPYSILKIKSYIIRYFNRNTTEWWVQTTFMKKLLVNNWHFKRDRVNVIPFFPPLNPVSDKKEAGSFLYVSEAHLYKQHLVLLKAFKMLANRYPFVKLKLTVTQNQEVLQAIDKYKKEGLNITNLGWLSKDDLSKEYSKNIYCVYPSLVESFGLGLIEAAQAGMTIIAADLPYVHAVIEPFDVFNPNDAFSIYKSMCSALESNSQASSLRTINLIDEVLKKLE